jgi:hypothetical protein
MDGKEMAQGLQDAFLALDKTRELATEELVKAANQALGADLFKYVSFNRHSKGIDIHLTARIPCEDTGFYDVG